MKTIFVLDKPLDNSGKASVASLNLPTPPTLSLLPREGNKLLPLPLTEPAHYVLCGAALGQLYLKDNKDYRRVEYVQCFKEHTIKVWHVEHPNAFKSFKSDWEALTSPQKFKQVTIDAFNDVEDESCPIVIDLETTQFNPFRQGSQIISVSLAQRNMGQIECWAGSFEDFYSFYEDNRKDLLKREWVAHNFKFDGKWVQAFGFEDLEKMFITDTMIVENLLNENTKKGLDALALKYTRFTNFWRKFNYDYFCSGNPLSPADLKALYHYNMCDTAATLCVHEVQPKVSDKLLDFEMDKLKLLLNIEVNGMFVDEKLLKRKMGAARRRQTKLKKLIVEHVASLGKEDFNIDSPKQIAEVLYDIKGFPILNTTNTGNPSTNGETIERLLETNPDDPLLQNMEETKFLGKMLSTYYLPIQRQLEENGNGFIRCNYNQAVADTFRLSSSDPNFQNLPSRNKEAVKPLFISRYPEGVIAEVDYSQAELRMLADLSGDENMLGAFNRGEDFHTATAEAMGVDRDTAKTLNFKVVYGGGSPEDTAKWFNAYPKAKAYMEQLKKEYHKTGRVVSLLGHTRHLGPVPKDWGLKAHKERQAVNMPIQCIAAQLTLIAIMLTEKYIKERNVKGVICNTVHDSGILDLSKADRQVLSDIKNIWAYGVRDWVERYCGHRIKVELKADVSWGPSWGVQEEEL